MDIKEVRMYWHGELACPNPREYHRHTRSFDDMRLEYDLLNCHKITDEDLDPISVSNIKGTSMIGLLSAWIDNCTKEWTYSAKVHCTNCRWNGEKEFVKGYQINSSDCSNCQCKTLALNTIPLTSPKTI